jgi:hypothetical protein
MADLPKYDPVDITKEFIEAYNELKEDSLINFDLQYDPLDNEDNIKTKMHCISCNWEDKDVLKSVIKKHERYWLEREIVVHHVNGSHGGSNETWHWDGCIVFCGRWNNDKLFDKIIEERRKEKEK